MPDFETTTWRRRLDIVAIFVEAQRAVPRKARDSMRMGWFHIDRILFRRAIADGTRTRSAELGLCNNCGRRPRANNTARCEECKARRKAKRQAQAQAQARKLTSAGHSFSGVTKNRARWAARIRIQDRVRFLGSFADVYSAAIAYDRAVIEHFGISAKLNFPEFAVPVREECA